MIKKIFSKLENPKRPLLGPNVKALKFWGLLLPQNVIKKYFYLFMHFAVTVFTATEYIDVWYVKSDLNLLLNNLKITMLATVSVCKVSTFLYWQKHWVDIIAYVTRADIDQRNTTDEKKLELIKNFTRYCRKITYLYWSLMYTTVVIVMVQPIFKYFSSESYRENVKNGSDMYLQVVSSWVPFEKNTMTGYLAASVYQSYAAIYGGGWITSFDTNAMVIMVFIRSELELLRIDSSNIFGTEQKPVADETALMRLKECHRRHVDLVKFARLFDSCLSPIMLLYMFVCSVMLCVTAYQITIETSPMQRFLTTEYLVFGVAQLFIYCWHSNDVLYASNNLIHGPFESTWWARAVKHRKNLYILTAQYKKNIVFSAGPFTKLTVATFISYIVAGSSLLAAIAAGGSLAYPSVLLQQLSSNETSIKLDWDTTSWIGSIHGIASIPSLIMPTFMQWQGRRLGFIIACLVSIVGWILSYTAASSTLILISESFNGFGAQCISSATAFSLSEMLSPQLRKWAMGNMVVMVALGMALIQIAGGYLHWRDVSLTVCAPLILTTLTAFIWPESPAWLAYKGKFDECERAFTNSRGTGEDARKELEELVLAQKENLSQNKKCYDQPLLKYIWQTLKRRDFYLPNIHVLILLLVVYWAGCMAHLIYAADIIESATHSKDAIFFGNMFFNCALVICCIISNILLKYVDPKKVILVCAPSAVIFLLSASAVNYTQTAGLMSKQSYSCLYLLIAYMISISFIMPIVLPMSGELTPVKHRGIAGPLQFLIPCILHTTSLKSVPYMLKYFHLWGMLLVFAAVATFSSLFTWMYIPETKGRTLQQLEDYYNYGHFDKSRRVDADKGLSELMMSKD